MNISKSLQFSGGNAKTPDPYWDNVVLLLDMETWSGGKPVDQSTALTTFAKCGTLNQSGTSKFGAYSLNPASGSGNYLEPTSGQAGFDFGTGAFTIEFWYKGSGSALSIPFSFGQSGSPCVTITFKNSGYEYYIALDWPGTSPVIYGSNVVVKDGAFRHIALTRDDSGNVKFFVDGASYAQYSAGLPYTGDIDVSASTRRWIGSGYATGDDYIDELRITKGVCRYTSNFLVPTGEFSKF